MEFSRGLLQEVVGKLDVDLKEVVTQDLLMAHLVDELLSFEKELQLISCVSTPPTETTTPPTETTAPPTETTATSPPPTEITAPPTKNTIPRLTVLTVLLDTVPFDKWRNLEKACTYVCGCALNRTLNLKSMCHLKIA